MSRSTLQIEMQRLKPLSRQGSATMTGTAVKEDRGTSTYVE
jgi:hypothetical protein